MVIARTRSIPSLVHPIMAMAGIGQILPTGVPYGKERRITVTEAEIKTWLQGLAPSNKGRIGAIKEMLQWAAEDDMSPEDREICERELAKLEGDHDVD